jgi:phosphoadenosine phosphosulfate reductase
MERSMQWLDHAPEGLRLPVTSSLEQVEAALTSTDTLILEFNAFRDGRGFSLASVLRERGFKGRLIADGRLIPDQARHLRRTGFDAVVIGADADVDAWRRMDQAFSTVYQAAEDGAVPAWRRDRAAAPWASEVPPPAPVAPSHLTPGVVKGLNGIVRRDSPETILWVALKDNQGLRPAVLSSFGAEAAVLLSFVARIDPTTPVVFLDTGMHFLQTLSYREALTRHLGLTDVRIVSPYKVESANEALDDSLWRSDPDACCEQRKVLPLERALEGIDLVITGRKRHQTPERATMTPFELFNGRIRVNPLMDWSPEQIEARFETQDLPRHPLSLNGYPSIGCWPCTRAVEARSPAREGRWAGAAKTECGIHLVRQAHSVG